MVDFLAKNTYENWANERIKEGWRYGGVSDPDSICVFVHPEKIRAKQKIGTVFRIINLTVFRYPGYFKNICKGILVKPASFSIQHRKSACSLFSAH